MLSALLPSFCSFIAMDEEADLVIVATDDPLPLPLQEESESATEDRRTRRTRTAPRTVQTKRHIFDRHGSRPVPFKHSSMKATVVVDEMFPEGAGPYVDIDEAGGSSGLLMDLAANEKSVHTDFFNQFEDLYDDEDLA
ncbi:hypothetical protein FOCC_FOCC014167 [Frankliniella occidentalis]|nr:hypothetical protein FOCC_FOCC014167 [Frankliniella occidentalis]